MGVQIPPGVPYLLITTGNNNNDIFLKTATNVHSYTRSCDAIQFQGTDNIDQWVNFLSTVLSERDETIDLYCKLGDFIVKEENGNETKLYSVKKEDFLVNFKRTDNV